MKQEELDELISKYQTGLASAKEKSVLLDWYFKLNEDEPFDYPVEEHLRDSSIVWEGISRHYKAQKIRPWLNFGTAASIFVVVSFGFYFMSHNSIDWKAEDSYVKDILPAGNRATLTLGNGENISLRDLKQGELPNTDGVNITKRNNGLLVYNAVDSKGTVSSAYHTMKTPKGGIYQLTLPDGTNVWLNAASTLKYPASFRSRQDRRVELDGEAYFEVTHNKNLPFKVVGGGQVVEVLGTHFSVNTYAKKSVVSTTLMEGKVKIGTTVLKPGEEALNTNGKITIASADLAAALDWKNGDFVFRTGDDFKSIMNTIARWYDVDIVYELDKDPDIEPGGSLKRNVNLAVVLEAIESSGNVHFIVKDRTVTVKNK